MTARDFCFWLQGFFEIDGVDSVPDVLLNEKQVKLIKTHLQLVFKHDIDPQMGPPHVQDDLNKIHASASSGQSSALIAGKEQFLMRC